VQIVSGKERAFKNTLRHHSNMEKGEKAAVASAKGAAGTTQVRFKLEYHTAYGQHVAITGNQPELGSWNAKSALKLHYLREGEWEGVANFAPNTQLEYKFLLVNDQGVALRWEDGPNRGYTVPDVDVELGEIWRTQARHETLIEKTSAFKILYQKQLLTKERAEEIVQQERAALAKETKATASNEVLVQFRVKATRIPEGKRVAIVGSYDAVGDWQVKNAVSLESAVPPIWTATVKVKKNAIPFEYKYIITDDNGHDAEWETGANRMFSVYPSQLETSLYVRDDEEFRFGGPGWKGAGVVIPVFSIRTKQSLGIGEFLDVKKMADWAKLAGLSLIQMLPVNDTSIHGTWWDSYPYSSTSVCALHPIYINIPALGDLPKDILTEVAAKQKELDLEKLDYEAVLKTKTSLLKRVYALHKAKWLASKELTAFVEEHKDWLPAYALFCHFKDQFETADFNTWPEHKTITQAEVEKLTSKTSSIFADVIAYHYWVQYHLSKQLTEAANYAASKGIALKGDLPIGVDPLSVDVWTNPHLFRLHKQTGAPPDYFSTDGQNWGFPTYNWEEMAKDNYAWWRQRLAVMEKYFHAYRIDHVLGFFRIWEIPQDQVRGLIGRFHPVQPLWRWELETRGIWDLERLTEPYVTWDILRQYFWGDAEEIAHKYFNEWAGRLAFKPEYNTEKKVRDALALPEDADPADKARNEHIKTGLWDLLGNVCLIKDEEDPHQKFHPRVLMSKTLSFAHLDGHIKHELDGLYVDYFFKRQDHEWALSALKKLGVLRDASDMLICVEDLGMIPDCVQGVLDHLALIALRVQRMPADPKQEFAHPNDYPYLSVCTPATHDTSTIRGWWEEDRASSQRFYNFILGEWGQAPHYLEPWVAKKILEQHLYCPSMWAIFAIQDWFAVAPELRIANPQDERINIPAIRHHNWCYRIQVPVEDLIEKYTDFTSEVHTLVTESGRI
jgi:4-alpha-glucanotransferase